jgi:sugar O-acyltransferase (sialic acid O-acetyltransferase NeuD family)
MAKQDGAWSGCSRRLPDPCAIAGVPFRLSEHPVRDLIIGGAGGASREIAWMVEEINRLEPRWNLLGFLDDDPEKQDLLVHGYPVLGPLSAAPMYSSSYFIVGIASYRNRMGRRNAVERMELSPDRFATLIHPSVWISRHARVGVGTAILANVVIAPDAVIGSQVLVSTHSTIGHDSVLEDFVTLAAQVNISGGAYVGPYSYLGARSVLRDGIRVGAGALVGIGSVVVNDVEPGVTVFGNPARPLPKTRGETPRGV